MVRVRSWRGPDGVKTRESLWWITGLFSVLRSHSAHREALCIQTCKTNLGLSHFLSRALGLLFPSHPLSPLLSSLFLSSLSEPDGPGHAYLLHSSYSITQQQLLPQFWLEGSCFRNIKNKPDPLNNTKSTKKENSYICRISICNNILWQKMKSLLSSFKDTWLVKKQTSCFLLLFIAKEPQYFGCTQTEESKP